MDRLSLVTPISDFDRDRSKWHSFRESGHGAGRVAQWSRADKVAGGTVFIGVEERSDLGEQSKRPVRALTAKVEFNPARIGDPDGWELVDADRARSAAGLVAGVAEGFVSPVAELGAWRTKRADVARDFRDVERPGELVRGLAPLPRPWARRNLVHADPKRHGAQTLMVGSGAGLSRLYDKHAETGGRAPEGSLRFEIEARGDWLENYGGIRVLGDVTEDRCLALAADRWRWSAMGTEVSPVVEAYERVRRSPLSEREKAGLLAFLMAQASGDLAYGSRTTVAKYRRLQKALGVSLEGCEGARTSVRLDWESGTAVYRAG